MRAGPLWQICSGQWVEVVDGMPTHVAILIDFQTCLGDQWRVEVWKSAPSQNCGNHVKTANF